MMLVSDILNSVPTSRSVTTQNNKSESDTKNAASFDDYVKDKKTAEQKTSNISKEDEKNASSKTSDELNKNYKEPKKILDDDDTKKQDIDAKSVQTDAAVLLQQFSVLKNVQQPEVEGQEASLDAKQATSSNSLSVAVTTSAAVISTTNSNTTTTADATKIDTAMTTSDSKNMVAPDLELQTALKSATEKMAGDTTGDSKAQSDNSGNKEQILDEKIQKTVVDISQKTTSLSNLSIGDKVSLQTNKSENSMFSRILDVDVTENKQVGNVRVLHVQLTPDNLGSVEARLRLGENGLHVELRAERQETARLLADDHKMLTKTLESAGYKDDGRVSITIVDKSQTVQSSQSSSAGQGATQGDSGQNFNGQRQNFAQNGQGGQNGSNQNFEQFSLTESLPADITMEEKAVSRNNSRLVV